MKTEPQAITDKMIERLAVALDALWEDGERFTTFNEWGEEIEFFISEEMTAPIKARVLARARDEMQLVLPMVGEHCLTPDYLQRFADRYCLQARTEVQEKCDEISNEIRNEIFEV